jgi:hypothetical protein
MRQTPGSPAALVINDEQAAIVRTFFEMFASDNFGLVTICRYLEERHILTRTGKSSGTIPASRAFSRIRPMRENCA